MAKLAELTVWPSCLRATPVSVPVYGGRSQPTKGDSIEHHNVTTFMMMIMVTMMVSTSTLINDGG